MVHNDAAEYARYLGPSAEWIPRLKSGEAFVNEGSNRVAFRHTGRYAATLVPVQGAGLAEKLARLPASVEAAHSAIASVPELARIAPALEALKLTASIGALASVANLSVSCIGFALVLNRLARIDGKLDDVLSKVESLKRAVDQLHVRMEALSIARVLSAGESLARAIVADSETTRRELANDARRLFQETRKLCLELWRNGQPLLQLDVPLMTAMELQGRYVAAALGEIQAEFIIGDEGAFRHAVESCATEFRLYMACDKLRSFRARSDGAASRGQAGVLTFQSECGALIEGLKVAVASSNWTAQRLGAFAEDIEIAKALSLRPWELARIVQSARGDDFYLLGPMDHMKQWVKAG